MLLSKIGISSAGQIGVGTEVLGLDSRRERCFRPLLAITPQTIEDCYLVTSLAGEVLISLTNVLMTIGEPRDVAWLRRNLYKTTPSVSRVHFGKSPFLKGCAERNCVALVFQWISSVSGVESCFVRDLSILSNATQDECRITASDESAGYFVKPLELRWRTGSASHQGPCRGFELLKAIAWRGRTPADLTGARQALLLQRRLNGSNDGVDADPKYSPFMIGMFDTRPMALDRLRAILFAGPRPVVTLKFEAQFDPLVGLVPFR
jgi:hypothetical protein